jgi:hypothetical protein
LHCFSADQLRSVAVPHPSDAILTAVGTPSVAEAAALLASWDAGGERGAGAAEERRSGKEGQQEQKKLPQGEASKHTRRLRLPTPDSRLPIPNAHSLRSQANRSPSRAIRVGHDRDRPIAPSLSAGSLIHQVFVSSQQLFNCFKVVAHDRS